MGPLSISLLPGIATLTSLELQLSARAQSPPYSWRRQTLAHDVEADPVLRKAALPSSTLDRAGVALSDRYFLCAGPNQVVGRRVIYRGGRGPQLNGKKNREWLQRLVRLAGGCCCRRCHSLISRVAYKKGRAVSFTLSRSVSCSCSCSASSNEL